jgi:hypothetical protein
MKHHFLKTTALTVGLALPVHADPTIGVGVSLSFGGGGMEAGAGVRLFSDDEEESTVGTLGLDYMVQSQRWRPTVGVAYLGENTYVGIDLGYNLLTGSVDYGVGVGGLETVDTNVEADPEETVTTTAGPTTTGPTTTGLTTLPPMNDNT